MSSHLQTQTPPHRPHPHPHTRPSISTPTRTPTHPRPRGLYTNNTWTCDCTPRQPAACFQTKKGGVNQGRWFYTCPRPRDGGCRFFLWVDEARAREGGGGVSVADVVPSAGEKGDGKSRGGDAAYVTPLRTGAGTGTRMGLLTPNTGMGRKRGYDDGNMSVVGEESVKMRRRREVVVKREVGGEGVDGSGSGSAADEEFGWDGELEDGFVGGLGSCGSRRGEGDGGFLGRRRGDDMPMPRAMRKSPGWFRGDERLGGWDGERDRDGNRDGRGGGRDSSPSPCPRPRPRESGRFSPLFLRDSPAAQPPSTPETPSSTQNPLTTPSRTTTSANSFDISTPHTPTPIRFNPPPPPSTTSLTSTRTSTSISSTTPGTIVSQTLALLTKHSINMSPAATQELVALLNTHHLRTQGIMKGRDISRLAIKTRDERIRALMGRVEGLEAEREAWRVGRLRGRGED
ncbi:hypothetical protein FQN51_005746 [Onygenales sp. PD_10]|nr:hypothetical protein FQN51_005746 [Onygenales sp. PD_10]